MQFNPPPVASDEGLSKQIPKKEKQVGNGGEFSFGVGAKRYAKVVFTQSFAFILPYMIHR
jgi:hypothetical protein